MNRRWFIRALPLILISLAVVFSFIRADESEALIITDGTGNVLRAINPGELAFLPRRLMPDGIVVYRLPLHGRYLRTRHSYHLPQHELLGLDQSFAVQLVLSYRYSIDSGSIQELVRRIERPDSDSLTTFLQLRLSDFWYSAFRERLNVVGGLDTLEQNAELYIRSDLISDLNQVLSEDGIHIEAVLIEDIIVPDPERYRAVLANGQRIIEERLKRLGTIEEARVRKSAEEILLAGKRKHFQDLGELLGRYPDLREYIAIDGLNDRVQVFVMPYDRFTGANRLPSHIPLPGENDSGLHRFGPAEGRPDTTGGFRDLTPP